MKTRRRVLVIARHFWPATNDDTLRLSHWIQHLRSLGADAVVATPRWHRSWPRSIVCDGVLVQRIDHPPIHALRWGRYTRQLGQWIGSMAMDFDAIYCDSVESETAAVFSLPEVQRLPLMLRYSCPPRAGQANQPPPPIDNKTLAPVRRASVILAADAASERQLLAAGISRRAIVRTPQSNGSCYDRSPQARSLARQILGSANRDLFARSQDRVVVCPGELTHEWYLMPLIRELAPLIENHRSLRVWLLGDGPARGPIYEGLRHEGLHRMVAMPGLFTDMQEIFQAADLCIFPAPGRGLTWLLPTCIRSGVPVLVSDSPEARRQLGVSADELTYTATESLALRQRVEQWLRHPSPVAQRIEVARQQLLRDDPVCVGLAPLFSSLEATA